MAMIVPATHSFHFLRVPLHGQGIRVVKYFCWESAKADRVSETREVEMSFVKRQELLYALNRRARDTGRDR